MSGSGKHDKIEASGSRGGVWFIAKHLQSCYPPENQPVPVSVPVTPVASDPNQQVIGAKSSRFPNATKPIRDFTCSRSNMRVNPANVEKLNEKANCLRARTAPR